MLKPWWAWASALSVMLFAAQFQPMSCLARQADTSSCLAYQSSWAQNLTSMCKFAMPAAGNSSGSDPAADALYDMLAERLAQLLSVCTETPAVPIRPFKILAARDVQAIQTPMVKMAEVMTGFKIETTYMHYPDIFSEAKVQLDNKMDGMDIWVYDSTQIIDVAESAGGFGFEDLKPFIERDEGVLQWSDVHPYYRQVTSLYQGKVIGLPSSAFQSYLYYRRDIFEKYNLSVPVTWEEYMQVVKQLNGTDFNGDGVGDFSLCMSSFMDFETILQYSTIVASYVQTGGTSQGLLFDAVTGELLMDNEALRATLHLLLDQMKYIPPDKSITKNNNVAALADFSKCAMGLYTAEMFKASWQWPKVKGKMGVAMVPGATQVLDRTTGKLVPCTPSVCSDTITDATGKMISINRAPSAGFSTLGNAMNPHIAPELKSAVWKVMATLASPEVHGQLRVYNKFTPWGPVRTSQMDTSPEGLARWTKLGYDINDTLSFLTITKQILAHPNLASDLSCKNGRAMFLMTWSELTELLEGRQSVETTVQHLDSKLRGIIAASGDFSKFIQGYRDYIKYVPASPPPPGSSAAATASSSSVGINQVVVPAVVVPVVFVICLVMLAMFIVYKAKKARAQYRSLFGGAILPPKLGRLTTLMVTDVEGSTALFEANPQAMDAALAVHNAIMSSVLERHAGYASASEGDGWVVAFHTPNDALLAAAALQEALLTAEWPEGLLRMPGCAPVWVTPSPAGPPHWQATWATLTKSLEQKLGAQSGIHHVLAVSNTVGDAHTVPSRGASSVFDTSLSGTSRHNTSALAGLSTHGNGPLIQSRKSRPLQSLDSRNSKACAPPGASFAQGPFLGLSLQDLWSSMFTQEASGREQPHLNDTILSMFDAYSACSAGSLSSQLVHLPQEADPTETTPPSQLQAANPLKSSFEELTQQDPARYPRASSAAISFVDKPSSLPQALYTAVKSVVAGLHNRKHQRLYPTASLTHHGGVLVFRGLRVRAGLHSGLDQPADMVLNRTTGRQQYGGGFLAAAKSVSDAAHGGMVLASQETFQQASWASLSNEMAVLSAGEHVLKPSSRLPSVAKVLYEVIPHHLALRVTVQDPNLRSAHCKQPGYLAAPCGSVTIAYFQAVGIPALMSWDADVTQSCVQAMNTVATGLLTHFGGYLLDLSEALGVLAAFNSSGDAIRWALITQRALLHADWPQELLEHPLGEELTVTTLLPTAPDVQLAAAGGQLNASSPGRPTRKVKFAEEAEHGTSHCTRGPSFMVPQHAVHRSLYLRGLRVKCGIDVGEVRSTINELSGRITYIGKVMNRAARITQATKSGQVWCTATAWDLASTLRLPLHRTTTVGPQSDQGGLIQPASALEQAGPSCFDTIRSLNTGEPASLPEPVSHTHVNIQEADAADVLSRSSTHESGEWGDADELVQALTFATDLSAVPFSGNPLPAMKLKSIQDAVGLVQCELDKAALAQYEIRLANHETLGNP